MAVDKTAHHSFVYRWANGIDHFYRHSVSAIDSAVDEAYLKCPQFFDTTANYNKLANTSFAFTWANGETRFYRKNKTHIISASDEAYAKCPSYFT